MTPLADKGSRPPGGSQPHYPSAALHEQQATTKRRRGHRAGARRGKDARTVRAINAVASQRNAAWQAAPADAGHLVDGLTHDLDGLYECLRDERKGDVGPDFRGRSASFVTPPSQPPRPWRGER